MSGLAASLLWWSIESIKSLIVGAGSVGHRLLLLALPGAGMLLSLLALRFLVKDDISHGVTKVLLAVSRNESRIKPHNTWSSILTSALTIGFGGSVGAEAPIVYTGAAIGSNLGQRAGLSYRSVTILLGCGAAGALAGIFKAPLAGVLFTMEILLFNITLSSMLPLLVSTISATVTASLLRGQTPLFACELTPFSMGNLPFYIVLGIILGFGALYFTNTTLWLEDKIARIRSPFLRWALCASALGLMIFLFPELYGEGYSVVSDLLAGKSRAHGDLTGWMVPLLFTAVFLVKVFAMTATNSGGGNGGTFGPTLFCGAVAGFAVARCFNLAGASLPEQNFVLTGMAALMAGVMQAPMTAIFLIAEISGGYALLIPLTLASTAAYGTVRFFNNYSIYSKRIAQSGDLLTHDSDQAVLTLMHTRDLIRDKYPRLILGASLRELVAAASESTAAVIAITDAEGKFQGLIDLGNVRKYLLQTELYDSLKVENIMEEAPATLGEDEKMESVMAKFDSTGAWRLPVLDRERRYLGFISRSRLLTAYRNELRAISNSD